VNCPPDHINYFDKDSMSSLINNSGFEILSNRTYGFNIEPIKRRMKILSKNISCKKTNSSVKMKTISKEKIHFHNKLLSSIYFNFNYFNFGDKICLLAKKPS
jgi:hypothetical protein